MSAVVSLIVQKYGTRRSHNYTQEQLRLSSVSQDIEPTVKRKPTMPDCQQNYM